MVSIDRVVSGGLTRDFGERPEQDSNLRPTA
jgi:hypothetical protein